MGLDRENGLLYAWIQLGVDFDIEKSRVFLWDTKSSFRISMPMRIAALPPAARGINDTESVVESDCG